jgi:hypothetical protein
MVDNVSGPQNPHPYRAQYKIPPSFDDYYKKHFPTATQEEREKLFDGFMKLYMDDFMKPINDAIKKQKELDQKQREDQG